MPAKRKYDRRKRGTGTIQRQRDGSYIARTADKSRSGRFAAGPEGYRAAEEALERWNRALSAGRDPNDSRMHLRDFLALWITEVCQPPRVQPSTREFYTRHAEYATNYIGDIPLELINEHEIERMQSKLAIDGLSARSINHVRAVLRNALNVAKRWKLIPENPAANIRDWPVDEETGIVLTPAQVATLFVSVEGTRFAALYHVALTLGLRRGELLALRWIDIDWDAGLISVEQTAKEGDGRKLEVGIVKSRKARLLPMTPDLAARLRQRQAEDQIEARITQQRATEKAESKGLPIPIVRWNPRGLVFCSDVGTLIQPSNFYRGFVALVRRINAGLGKEDAALMLPADLSPHDMRHTALTDLAAHGEAKAVQNIAGHADIDTTMRLYAGRRMGAMRAAVEAMEEGRRAG